MVMKKDNKITENTYNNMVDFNQYINPDNELSEEILQAYLNATDIETPDLWSRIDAGFDSEVTQINNEKKLNKKRNKKFITFIAAAFLITLIAIPIVMLGGRSNEKDMVTEGIKSEDIAFETMEEESVAATEYAEESAEENEAAMEEAPVEDMQESDNETVMSTDDVENSVESAPTDVADGNADEGITEPEGTVRAYKAFLFREPEGYCVYISHDELTFFFEEGDYVLIKNHDEFERMMEETNIEIDGSTGFDEFVDVVFENVEPYYDDDYYDYQADVVSISVREIPEY